jgi:hypothetical protein
MDACTITDKINRTILSLPDNWLEKIQSSSILGWYFDLSEDREFIFSAAALGSAAALLYGDFSSLGSLEAYAILALLITTVFFGFGIIMLIVLSTPTALFLPLLLATEFFCFLVNYLNEKIIPRMPSYAIAFFFCLGLISFYAFFHYLFKY